MTKLPPSRKNTMKSNLTSFPMFDKHTQKYLNVAQQLVNKHDRQGADKDRTGIGRTRIFGRNLRFDMTDGSFPLITCKHVPFKLVQDELYWFLKGHTNINYLAPNNHIWDKWALKQDVSVDKECGFWEHIAETINPNLSLTERLMKIPKALVGDWTYKHTYHKGEIGPLYGKTWRDFDGVDQIKDTYNLLASQPYTARACVSAWDPKNFPIVDPSNPSLESDYEFQVTNGKMALNPCHAFFQFLAEPMSLFEQVKWLLNASDYMYSGVVMKFNENFYEIANSVRTNYPDLIRKHSTDFELKLLQEFLFDHNVPSIQLSLQLTQRSCDWGLGAPFNIASYALLLHMYAKGLNYAVKEFIYSVGDCHLYSNQIETMRTMLKDAEANKEVIGSPELSSFLSNYPVNPERDPVMFHDIKFLKENGCYTPWAQPDVANAWAIKDYRSMGVYKMQVAA